MISVVINTCAGSRNPKVLDQRGSFGNPGKRTYGERAEKLGRSLDNYASYPVEIIVVGEWEPGPGYLYVPSPGIRNDPTDQIPQRHAGAQAATGDVLIFLNDDHFVRGLPFIEEEMLGADVGVFTKRYARTPTETVRLDTGWPAYVMGHACVLSRHALDAVPWGNVPTHTHCDVSHTALLRKAELTFKELTIPVVWDIETGGMPNG